MPRVKPRKECQIITLFSPFSLLLQAYILISTMQNALGQAKKRMQIITLFTAFSLLLQACFSISRMENALGHGLIAAISSKDSY
jgi:O-antigen/teichoic acid export membrane protein